MTPSGFDQWPQEAEGSREVTPTQPRPVPGIQRPVVSGEEQDTKALLLGRGVLALLTPAGPKAHPHLPASAASPRLGGREPPPQPRPGLHSPEPTRPGACPVCPWREAGPELPWVSAFLSAKWAPRRHQPAWLRGPGRRSRLAVCGLVPGTRRLAPTPLREGESGSPASCLAQQPGSGPPSCLQQARGSLLSHQ